MASWKDQYLAMIPREGYNPAKHGERPALYVEHPDIPGEFIVNPEHGGSDDPAFVKVYRYPKLIKHPRGYLIMGRYVTSSYTWAKRPDVDTEVDEDGAHVVGWYGNVSRNGEQFGTFGAFVTLNEAMQAAIDFADGLPQKEQLP